MRHKHLRVSSKPPFFSFTKNHEVILKITHPALHLQYKNHAYLSSISIYNSLIPTSSPYSLCPSSSQVFLLPQYLDSSQPRNPLVANRRKCKAKAFDGTADCVPAYDLLASTSQTSPLPFRRAFPEPFISLVGMGILGEKTTCLLCVSAVRKSSFAMSVSKLERPKLPVDDSEANTTCPEM